jgi:hypothetical protein
MNRMTLRPRLARVVVGAAVALGSLVPASSAIADPASSGSAPASTSGSFVIGDQNAAVGTQVTFWGAQWWKDNGLTGGSAPPSFKGFADTATPACGQPWTTRPGNSSGPPDTVAADLTLPVPMVVSSTITKDGPVISGDTTKVVLVMVDPGYGPNPGHPGTGTVVGIVCGGHGIIG